MKAAVSATEVPKSSVKQNFTKNPTVSLFHLLTAPNTDFVRLTIDNKCHVDYVSCYEKWVEIVVGKTEHDIMTNNVLISGKWQ